MNEKDNNKANAAILLSADEAVAKKILDVLMKHPDVLRNAIKQMHLEDERRQQEIRNQMYQQSVAAQAQGMRNAYRPGMAVQITEDQLQPYQKSFWDRLTGGSR